MVFFCTQIDGDHNGAMGIHLHELVGNVLVFIRHAGKMLHAMGYSGPVAMETTLSSILGIRWLEPSGGMLFPSAFSELDEDVAFSIATTTEELIRKGYAFNFWTPPTDLQT